MKSTAMWINVVVLLFCMAVAAAGSDSNQQEDKVRFCQLVSTPQDHDKKVVLTEALMLPSDHSVALYDPACWPTETNNVTTQTVLPDGWNSTKLGKKLEKLLSHQRTAKVSVEGTFYGSGGPYGPDVARFRFVVQRIISVEAASKADMKRPASPTEASQSGTTLLHESLHAQGIEK